MFKKAALATVIASALSALSAPVMADAPKYVFFFIGDGMALQQRDVAETYLSATEDPAKLTGRKELTMSTFPVHGITTTYSLNDQVTDSAAAGTALAIGKKTNSGFIAMTPDGKAHDSIADLAKDNGMKVGMISTVMINHATPAAFYSNAASRGDYHSIAMQMPESGFDFFAGGHLKEPRGEDGDLPSAYDAIAKAGYKITRTEAEMNALKPGQKALALSPVTLRQGDIPWAIDKNEDKVTLAEYVDKGIEMLDNDKDGFFMMVEAGKIDWAGHQNDAKTNIYETLALDSAVDVAYEFYKKHPKDTLIVVTGDHETGGMSMGFVDTYTNYNVLDGQTMAAETFGDKIVAMRRDGKLNFNDTMALIEEAFGLRPGTKEEFAQLDKERDETTKRTKERKAVDEKIARLLNDIDMKRIKTAFEDSQMEEDPREDMWKDTGKEWEKELAYGGKEPLAVTMSQIINSKAGIGWTTYDHSSIPVVTSAVGVGAKHFAGYYDNTDVFEFLRKAMDI